MSKENFCLTVFVFLLIMLVSDSSLNVDYDKFDTIVALATLFVSVFDRKDFKLGMLLHFMHRGLLFN